MNRKLNLANIKKHKNMVDAVVKSPKKLTTHSPHFSPIANRTRQHNIKNKKKDDKGISLAVPIIETSVLIKAEPNLPKKPLRHHVKVEFDENESFDASNTQHGTLKADPYRKATKHSFDEKNLIKHEEASSSNTQHGTLNADPDRKATKHSFDEKNLIKHEEASSSTIDKHAKWEPENWLQVLSNIREMRKKKNAPVDTMGCHKCSDEDTDEKTQRFHHLVALMLSSQTKDGVTYEAMGRLKRCGLTPEKMVQVNTSDLEKILHPVSFYKTKAKSIQKTSQILIEKFDSDIPNDIKGLISLPGVGPKMAHICMRVAWNEVTGIGVDTHVHRITNRLKWLPKETKEPEQTRIALEKWLPFEYWTEINELLVGFGQTICTPTKPKCGECLNYDICPSRIGKKVLK